MPRFEPFSGLRYALGTDHDAVTAPPYDVIDLAERAALAGKSPENVVRFDLPVEADGPGRYTAAAELLSELRTRGVLEVDADPAFYVYRMTYDDELGCRRHTTGIIGALELSRPTEGQILPHEHTTPKAKTDRLDLLRATSCNLSCIWGLSLAPGLSALCAVDGVPLARATDDDGVVHEMWSMSDGERVDAIRGAVAAHPIVVADGHHRYEVSLAYRDERRAADGPGPWDLAMTYVVELTEDELAVRPIHRLLHGVSGEAVLDAVTTLHFDPEPADPDAELPSRMEKVGALGLVLPGGRAWLLRPRPGVFAEDLPDLDSSRLDAALADVDVELEYQHGAETVLRRVAAGEGDAGVLLRPATVAQIRATASGGDRMPPKTTFFWPKPRTGFVFRSLSDRPPQR